MDTINRLLENGGPVVHYRTQSEIIGADADIEEVINLTEVNRWLELLGTGPVHHGRDESTENCLAKLAEYGLKAGIPILDAKVEQALKPKSIKTEYDYYILLPFLVRLGYHDHPVVQSWFDRRLEALLKTAHLNSYDIYMTEEEKLSVPPSLRGKRLYKPIFSEECPLPSCYDFLTLAYGYRHFPAARISMDTVLAYLLDGRFQTTPGGYQWNAKNRRHYAAGRGYLATLPVLTAVSEWQAVPQTVTSGKGGVVYPDAPRLILFMEAGARLSNVRESQWFRDHIDYLESFKTGDGLYHFPKPYLQEKEGYYLYSGSHMGLAENRRKRVWAQIESTFRMALLQSLLQTR